MPDGRIEAMDLGAVDDIDAAIHGFSLSLRDRNQSPTRAARTLAAHIFNPIRPYLSDLEHLLISPDSQLNLIPFEALRDSEGNYLIEQYLISYLNSGRVPNAEILTEAQATENALKQLEAPCILHIATHGFFLEDVPRPTSDSRGLGVVIAEGSNEGLARASTPVEVENPLLRSGLALAGFNPRRSGDEDGVLTPLEASTLNLLGTQLVVLSACDTGLGDIANGEGVYGLRRAFAMAGAETQLISLWQVDDFGTQSLMGQYYEQLLSGKGRAEALREVQLAMINSGSSYAHPYYWAAFITTGDWRPLD
jgi:CHAT domain-containing protein